ncbi:MAG: hypothetical protein ACRD15_03470 [Vicinamibacterales bacterium]
MRRIEHFEVLLQGEDVLGTIVAGQRGDDRRLGRAAAIVAVFGELDGVATAASRRSSHHLPQSDSAIRTIAVVRPSFGQHLDEAFAPGLRTLSTSSST